MQPGELQKQRASQPHCNNVKRRSARCHALYVDAIAKTSQKELTSKKDADGDVPGPEIQELINEELRNMQQEDAVDPFLDNELRGEAGLTTSTGEKLEKTIDTARYRLPVPESDDVDAWQAAVDNAKAQLEQQHNRYLMLTDGLTQ